MPHDEIFVDSQLATKIPYFILEPLEQMLATATRASAMDLQLSKGLK